MYNDQFCESVLGISYSSDSTSITHEVPPNSWRALTGHHVGILVNRTPRQRPPKKNIVILIRKNIHIYAYPKRLYIYIHIDTSLYEP